MLFITHRLNEVIQTCDRATILRDGGAVATIVPQEGGEETIVTHMLGEAVARAAVPPRRRGCDGTRGRGGRRAGRRRGASPSRSTGSPSPACTASRSRSRAGEVLGIAALDGQGQDQLFDALAGAARVDGGEIRVAGRPLKARHPYDAIRAGVVLVPADRLHALLPQRSVRENIASPRYNSVRRWGPISMPDEGRRVRDAIAALQIDTRAAPQVRRLSGGNQQKVTIARWLASGFRTMLCFDPTRGIDVGTKRQIYALLRSLADDGAAILFFSSELAEFPLVCDRVLTLYGGRDHRRASRPGGRRGDAPARDARPRRREAEVRVSATTAPVAVRRVGRRPPPPPPARLDGRRLRAAARAHLLLALGDGGAVGAVRRAVGLHRRAPARVRRVRAGDRDHLRRDRPLDRLADEPRQRHRGAVDAEHELPGGARVRARCSSSQARWQARSPG